MLVDHMFFWPGELLFWSVSSCQGQAHVQAWLSCSRECENTCPLVVEVRHLQRRVPSTWLGFNEETDILSFCQTKTIATVQYISIHFIHTCFPCRFKSTKSLRMTHLDVLCASDAIWFHTKVWRNKSTCNMKWLKLKPCINRGVEQETMLGAQAKKVKDTSPRFIGKKHTHWSN